MFEWKPEYSVKLPEIDGQHQRLFALAGELHGAMAKGKGYTVLERALTSLVEYTKVHFAAEERFMNQHGYPQSSEHKSEHDKLTAQVVELQQRFRGGEATLSLSVLTFLQNWLEQHIARSDQRYSIYIRGKLAA